MVLLSTSAIAAEAPKTYNSIGADFNAQVLVAPSQKTGYYLLQFNGFEHDDVLITSSGHYTTRKASDFVTQIKAVY